MKFYAWLDSPGTLEAIAAWAESYIQQHGPISPARKAPTSATKRRAIEEVRYDGERIICDLGKALKDEKEKIVLRRDEIRQWLAKQKAKLNPNKYGSDGERGLEGGITIMWLLKGCGLAVPDKQYEDGKTKFRVVANFKIDETATWSRDLKEHYRKPEDVTGPGRM